MKHLRQTALLALAGLALATNAVQALTTYTSGDLLLGFRQGGASPNSQDYLINLGAASTFLNANTSFTLQLSQTDLNTLFGTNFGTAAATITDNTLFIGIGGTVGLGAFGLPSKTLFVSKAETTVGTQSTPFTILGDNGTAYTNINGKVATGSPGGFKNSTAAPAVGQSAGLQATIQAVSNVNSYAKFSPVSTSGGSFGAFTGGTGIEGSFANGAAGVALDLYVLRPNNGSTVNTGDPADYQGTLTINNNALLTFTPEPVPEPSSAVLVGLGLLGGVFGKRNRRK